MRNILSKLFAPFINFAIQFGHGYEINTENQNKIKDSISRTIKSSDGKWLPAALAYHIMIAIVPVIAIALLALAIIEPVYDYVIVILRDVIKDDSLFEALDPGNIGFWELLFILAFSVYSASRSIQAVHDMANYLYSGNKKVAVGPIIKKLKSVVTLGIIVGFAVGLAITVILIPQYLTSEGFRNVITLPYLVVEMIRFPVTAIILYYTCIILYMNISDRKVTWSQARPGALFFAITLALAFIGLSTLLNFGFLDYSSIYGSLAVMILLGLMSLGLSYILFLGMVINVSVEKNQKIHGTGKRTTLKNRWRRTFASVTTSVKDLTKKVKKEKKIDKEVQNKINKNNFINTSAYDVINKDDDRPW